MEQALWTHVGVCAKLQKFSECHHVNFKEAWMRVLEGLEHFDLFWVEMSGLRYVMFFILDNQGDFLEHQRNAFRLIKHFFKDNEILQELLLLLLSIGYK